MPCPLGLAGLLPSSPECELLSSMGARSGTTACQGTSSRPPLRKHGRAAEPGRRPRTSSSTSARVTTTERSQCHLFPLTRAPEDVFPPCSTSWPALCPSWLPPHYFPHFQVPRLLSTAMGPTSNHKSGPRNRCSSLESSRIAPSMAGVFSPPHSCPRWPPVLPSSQDTGQNGPFHQHCWFSSSLLATGGLPRLSFNLQPKAGLGPCLSPSPRPSSPHSRCNRGALSPDQRSHLRSPAEAGRFP